jgi:hypothetical protein
MKTDDCITVVIPVHNGAAFIERAVDSCLSAAPAPSQIILVDDGSDDGSVTAGQALQAKHAGRILFLPSPDGACHGVSAARNRGVLAASSEWVAFLDVDDYYFPSRFEDFTTARAKDADFDGLYQPCQVVFEEGYVESGNWREALCGVLKPLSREGLLQSLLLGRSWIPAGIIIRRELLVRAGLFDENLAIGEDCHLWARAACLGTLRPGRLDVPVAAYVRHGQNVTAKSSTTRVYTVELARSVLRWAYGRTDVSRSVRRALRDAMASLLVDCLMDFRACRQYALARQAMKVASQTDARVLCRQAVLRQIQALLRERLGLSQPPELRVGKEQPVKIREGNSEALHLKKSGGECE